MQNAKKQYILLSALFLTAVVGLVVMVIRYNQMFTVTATSVDHTIGVLNEDQAALSALHDFRLGTITIDPLRAHFEALQRLVADNPLQIRRVDSLLTITGGPRTTGLYQPESLETIRGLLYRLQTEENRVLTMRQAANIDSRRHLSDAIITFFGLAFALLCASIYIILYNFNRRKKAEKGLQESRDLVGLLVNHVKDYAIFMIDTQGDVLSWNQGAEQIKGYKKEEIIGKPISVFYTDEENARGEPGQNLKMAETSGRYECIGLRKRKDGSLFYADVVFTALRNEEGELTGFIKITKDISVQMQVREDLSRALAREKELNEMKSRFVTLASHEFKTPLSVILSSTNLIEKYQDAASADKRLRHVHRIKSNVNNLKQLLNDFLSLEKLEEGIVRNDPARTDLVKMAEEAMQDMEEACKDQQRIELEITGPIRDVAVDQHLLRNILNNLLSNAIKYSPASTLIRFRVEFMEKVVRFSVADQGIGIPAEEQEHLFERFFRAKNTAGISGTGLGLSIVKKYLDLMGGSITLESQPGTGSTFTITLPASAVFDDQVHPIR